MGVYLHVSLFLGNSLNISKFFIELIVIIYFMLHVIIKGNMDFFHCKLDSPYFYDVSWLDYIFNFIVIMLKTSDDEIHQFIQIIFVTLVD
jgi:hypothetical protein